MRRTGDGLRFHHPAFSNAMMCLVGACFLMRSFFVLGEAPYSVVNPTSKACLWGVTGALALVAGCWGLRRLVSGGGLGTRSSRLAHRGRWALAVVPLAAAGALALAALAGLVQLKPSVVCGLAGAAALMSLIVAEVGVPARGWCSHGAEGRSLARSRFPVAPTRVAMVLALAVALVALVPSLFSSSAGSVDLRAVPLLPFFGACLSYIAFVANHARAHNLIEREGLRPPRCSRCLAEDVSPLAAFAPIDKAGADDLDQLVDEMRGSRMMVYVLALATVLLSSPALAL